MWRKPQELLDLPNRTVVLQVIVTQLFVDHLLGGSLTFLVFGHDTSLTGSNQDDKLAEYLHLFIRTFFFLNDNITFHQYNAPPRVVKTGKYQV